jgi:glyoxylase-like metal-dependent hydrolase (beta-lactamase superfamily II)
MDVIELIPGLHFLRFPIGHAYLCQDPDGLTLIDTGVPGSAPQIATAIHGLGHELADLRRLLLTHFHADHAGSAAEIAAWGAVQVCAHHADAPFLRGEAPGPPPDLADWERPIFDQVTRQLPTTPPIRVRIDRELDDGDELAFGGDAVAVALPGHTPGSIGFYLPGPRVLLAGDSATRSPGGQVMPGVFNTDRAQATASFARLAALDSAIACFGHGEPITRDSAALLRAAAQQRRDHEQ